MPQKIVEYIPCNDRDIVGKKVAFNHWFMNTVSKYQGHSILQFLLVRQVYIVYDPGVWCGTNTYEYQRYVRYIFSSNHNIHKSSCGLCFWAPDPLIDRF